MTMDEGTPKRRRGLFRRDRAEQPLATEPRPGSSDGFDDPWSASAWDDWDDDFTAGGQRSSVPAAAAPRPEAVDAWLQSEANDFDDAARKNTKRWGGDATRTAPGAANTDASVGPGGFGLSARHRTIDEPPAPAFATDPASPATSPASLSGPASTTQAYEPLPIIHTPAELSEQQPSTPPPFEPQFEPQFAPSVEPVVEPAHVDPAPLPTDFAVEADMADMADVDDMADDLVDDLSMVDDEDSPGPVAQPGTTEDRQTIHTDLAEQLLAPTDDERSSATAPTMAGAPTPQADQATPSDDEMRQVDHLGADPDDAADLSTLDEEPTLLAPPAASWAPPDQVSPTPESEMSPAPSGVSTPTPSTVREPDRSDQSDRSDRPDPPREIAADFTPADTTAGGSASRFVSVSVVTDEDRAAAAALHEAENMAPRSRFERVPRSEFVRSEPAVPAASATNSTTPPTSRPPTSSRWARLSAEFDTDGDLDDSFPRQASARPAPSTPAASNPANSQTASDPGERTRTTERPAPVEQPRPAADDVTSDADEDPWSRPSPRTSQSVSPPFAAVARPRPPTKTNTETDTDINTDDPWLRPPVARADRPTDASPPPLRPDVSAAPPYLGEQAPDATETPVREPRRTRRPQAPPAMGPGRAAEPSQAAVDARVSDETEGPTSLHPDLSTFTGVIGSALVAFAAVRLVLTLVSTQPAVPARFTGTKADLLRIGQSFATSGTAWPVALVVGTVLLVLPGYLGLRSHLRRWAPMLGLALATGLGAIIVGYLRVRSGVELKSASTLKLVSDAIVGPIGFGVLTILSVAFGLRAARSTRQR